MLVGGAFTPRHKFLELLNRFFPSIISIMEIGGLTINFLDLTIRVTEESHTFCIYRKTTATDSYVNGSSFCPWPYKLVAFNWLIHRLVSIPMGRSDFEEEIATLEHLAEVNRVNLDLKRMIRKMMLRIQLDDTTSLPRSPRHDRELKWIRLPFLGKICHTLRTATLPLEP